MTRTKDPLCLENQKFFPVYLCAKELMLSLNSMLEPYGMTYTQFVVMAYLWETGESSVKEAADTLRLDPSTLTPLLKKLEQKEFITRKRDESDERSLIIKATEKGVSLKDQIMCLPGKAAQMTGLDSDELHTLHELICKVLNNIHKEK